MISLHPRLEYHSEQQRLACAHRFAAHTAGLPGGARPPVAAGAQKRAVATAPPAGQGGAARKPLFYDEYRSLLEVRDDLLLSPASGGEK